MISSNARCRIINYIIVGENCVKKNLVRCSIFVGVIKTHNYENCNDIYACGSGIYWNARSK